ncbi:MAG TPA: hypothetical protein VMN39_03405 [Longimicrobiaceae bacterium]|nr:hypothetical protein [Longimicrobiaceae bacterium]
MSDPLSRFDPPANWDDFPKNSAKRRALRDAWHGALGRLTEGASRPPSSYYDPLTTRIADAQPALVEWNAFPKRIEDRVVALPDKLAAADVRDSQEEYCEWCVERNSDGKIVRVTFTTEAIEYWDALWQVDPNRVLRLYRRWINPAVQLEDLRDGAGGYDRRNRWNTGGEILADRGGAMHMVVAINTLTLAVGVVAGAANQIHDSPRGGPFHADALIALAVSRLVQRRSQRVSFSNPVGVYLREPEFNRFRLPVGTPRDIHPRDFWTVVRGDRKRGRALRSIYEVPARLGFTVGDLEIDGRRVEHGSQIARTLKSGTYVTPIPR